MTNRRISSWNESMRTGIPEELLALAQDIVRFLVQFEASEDR